MRTTCVIFSIAAAVLAGCPTPGLFHPPSTVAVMLDASESFGESGVLNRCPELQAILVREVAQARTELRVMVLATGRGASPRLLFDGSFTPRARGFAVHGAIAAEKAAFVAAGVAACEARWKPEKTSPIRATLAALFDNIQAAEAEAALEANVIETRVYVVSDLLEEVDVAWTRARQRPTPERIAAIEPLDVPLSVQSISVCGTAESRSGHGGVDEPRVAKLVLERLLGARVPVLMAATCPKATKQVAP